jgi:hypothetical protein
MIKRILLFPDIHYPHHDEAAMNAVYKFTKWFKPHAINLTGDAMNMDSVNHWKSERGSKKYFEGKRLLKEYEMFDRDILSKIEKIVPKNCEKTYMGGNHEDWINTLIDKIPQLEGLVEPDVALNLKEREWEWIPWINWTDSSKCIRGIKKYGKVLVIHGQYTNECHSKKTALTFSKSVIYCHTHDLQSYTKVFADDGRGFHTAQSIGCLCNISPDYMRGGMNRWVNAFGVLYVREDGMYNLYVPVIIKGKFCFDGKIFDGNK